MSLTSRNLALFLQTPAGGPTATRFRAIMMIGSFLLAIIWKGKEKP